MADNVVIIKKMNAAQLLKALDLDEAYDTAIMKICKSRHMMQDQAGTDFLFGKLEELDAYIAANKSGTPTLEEVRPIIQEWIDLQEIEMEKERAEQNEGDETLIQQFKITFPRKEPGKGMEIKFKNGKEVEYILSTATYALISAGRNFKRNEDDNKPPEYFKERHALLKEELVNRGCMFIQVVGKYGMPEDPFLVMAHELNLDEAIEIGSAIDRDSVIHVSGGKQTRVFITDSSLDDGTPAPKGSCFNGKGWINVDAKASDNYTALDVGDKQTARFCLNFDWDKLVSCDRALTINPNLAEAWLKRGNALHDHGRYADAIDSYDKAIAIKPDYAEAWSNRGFAQGELERIEPQNILLWRFATEYYVWSSPVVSNGIVYVGSMDKNLYAIDAVTGKDKWRFATGGTVHSSPAVSNGIVYVGSYDKNLYAIDAMTGTEKWRFAMGGAVVSSPAVSNGVVYFVSKDHHLYAIDAVTGTEKWQFAMNGAVDSSPVVMNGIVYVGSWDKSLYAIDAVTGKEKWRFYTGGWVDSSPAMMNGIVYVRSDDKNLYAIDAVTGKEKWRFYTESYGGSSPVVSNGIVYLGCTNNNLYAIDAVTGTEKWRFMTGGYVKSSPAVSNGIVYVGSYDKNLYAIDAVTGKLHWRFKTEGEVHSSPEVANGVVYIGSDDYHLYAVEQMQPLQSTPP